MYFPFLSRSKMWLIRGNGYAGWILRLHAPQAAAEWSSGSRLWFRLIAVIALTVRFVGFSRGQYGAVNWGSTPVSLRKSLNVLLLNCEPLSHTSFLGAPKWLMIRSRKARIRVAVVAFRRGISSTHLVKVRKRRGAWYSRPVSLASFRLVVAVLTCMSGTGYIDVRIDAHRETSLASSTSARFL